MPIIKRLDGVGYPDFIYGQVALREFLLKASGTRILVQGLPGARPFDNQGVTMTPLPSPTAAPTTAAPITALAGRLPAEPLGAALMEFLCHADVRAHGAECAVHGVHNLVSHPFSRHIQVRTPST